MGFTVPNGPDAATVDQAEPDALDYQALGFRRTGVSASCFVTAQVSPNMSVNVAAGSVVLNGVPVTVGAGSVTIQTADATARFDLIVVDSVGDKIAIRGTASGSNPVFPACDLSMYVLLAAVYVGPGSSSITAAAIVDKRIYVELGLLRSYDADDDIAVETTSPAGFFRQTADGAMAWVESTLKRTGVSAMEMAASLVLHTGAGNSLLTLKARSSAPENQNVLDVQDYNGTNLASIDGEGNLQANNFFSGVGPPSGSTAPSGALYVDTTTPRTKSLYIHEGDGQWTPFKAHDVSDEAIPVGTMVSFLGDIASVPVGWEVLDGSSISTSAPETSELAVLLGTLYGSGTGTVNKPDFRGRIPIGAAGGVALTLGDVAGTTTATLLVDNLPAHSHPVTDPGHEHPHAGRAVYAPQGGALRPSTAPDPTPFALAAEDSYAAHIAPTGISVGEVGIASPFDIIPPVATVNWIVKAHATYKSLSAVSGENVIKLDDDGVVTYSTVDDIAVAVAAILA